MLEGVGMKNRQIRFDLLIVVNFNLRFRAEFFRVRNENVLVQNACGVEFRHKRKNIRNTIKKMSIDIIEY